MTHAPDPPSARLTPRRSRRSAYRPFALGVAGVSLAATALAGCSPGEGGEAGDSPIRTQPPTASDSPVDEVPSTDVTRKRLKGFYEKYLTALDGPSSGPAELRKERLSVHFRADLADKENGLNRGDAVTQSANTPHKVGEVSYDSTIDNHSWFLVELKWKGGKVPTDDSGSPDEPEYSPTTVRAQIDRDTQKISDVEVQEREPGPGQPEQPES